MKNWLPASQFLQDSLRSHCPIILALEVFGDRWSLLIIRDLTFAGKRHFREFLKSNEGISTRILADRLKVLLETGIITKADDPTHKQKTIYSLTEMGIDLLPAVVQIGIWGMANRPVTKESAAAAAALQKGGPRLWRKLRADLRKSHLANAQIERR